MFNGIFLFYILQRLTWIIKTTYWSQFSTKQWIESMTLVGYFTGHGDVINGTTWFLIPLFLFYLVRIGYAWIYEKIKPEYNFLFLELFVLLIMFLLKGFHLSGFLNVSVRLHASDGNDFRRNLSKRTANFNF